MGGKALNDVHRAGKDINVAYLRRARRFVNDALNWVLDINVIKNMGL